MVFHRGAEIRGDHRLLQGGGKVARYIRFIDEAAVADGADGLSGIVRAWCESRD